MNVTGKVAVVAGGASGLGRAVCTHLGQAGASVAVLDRDGIGATALAAELPAAIGIEADVADAGAVERALDRTLAEFGAVHIGVNTAGVVDAARIVSRRGPAALDDFERVVRINLCGTFNVMRVAVAAMLANEPDEDGERGVMINTASGAAYDGQSGQAAYSASKAGVIGLALPVARDLAGTGVRVNTIAPGLFETPMTGSLPDRVRTGIEQTLVEPSRMGRPEEFARMVRSIVENGYLNAECIRLDAAVRPPAR
ncbi:MULTISPECIES: SDR family NAD(P)-dependent oxidoreductase [Pseudonocardia]|uniref:3-oxoacyl-[acyl-carrier-protein] reductase FabG n=2 Tax=Pseudonocardia TaxID=1847 RepID=A0A1Y2NBG9_PSEAH|nr:MULTISPECIES: SDR family NAD(P)-dependent oxidoreductase [Pseudonocardia]OSY44238.1 3-oxoacyl-[acyl-carrier-protein] reductase FabG [Pseudonocardia autotrophica]TDN74032.1 NAD(P)-dependent dehydrogenase (short-subunit alcohol dehydrogenase family) [Pseudonocardia autotrophica]BBG04789.1 3-hydroxyacyl-CoA dehydrogenase [Pseudonocardia autotrophica]GEC23445.1 3-hydroxyacyl-CoA dehydrogenase [Pseudonocardia saturnea]